MKAKVDAVRWDGRNWDEVVRFAGTGGMWPVWLSPGDWLIRTANGDLHRWRPPS